MVSVRSVNLKFSAVEVHCIVKIQNRDSIVACLCISGRDRIMARWLNRENLWLSVPPNLAKYRHEHEGQKHVGVLCKEKIR